MYATAVSGPSLQLLPGVNEIVLKLSNGVSFVPLLHRSGA
jgi:hypothetical protein